MKLLKLQYMFNINRQINLVDMWINSVTGETTGEVAQKLHSRGN